ncbi:predicted protein [Histoplasma mississippiense (nom. inval.)]|uniref:predicted protein n=1 Tax=Ajellomyces capsulatus (strain NAm1 / WU24) TaxID=2059318 RepID=UPI000157C0D4|nr:predicted protein [Histoplasma mississippiense (nom. inval.)]EDN06902.1 predicted protein [Histoplasma mississippiense (nom. inval.)]
MGLSWDHETAQSSMRFIQTKSNQITSNGTNDFPNTTKWAYGFPDISFCKGRDNCRSAWIGPPLLRLTATVDGHVTSTEASPIPKVYSDVIG